MNYFPDIKEAYSEYTESGNGSVGHLNRVNLIECDFKCPCANIRLCSSQENGVGFDFSDIVLEMREHKLTTKEGFLRCRGRENMGRHQTRSCGNHIQYKITIQYA